MTNRLDGWQEPSDQLVTEVLARIGDPQHRQVFFERLENPRWVSALAGRGVFATPPTVRKDGEGREFWLPWPDGDFLARMAGVVPEEVLAALLPACESENAVVRGAIMRAAIAMPVEFSARLVEPLARFLADGTFNYSPEINDLLAIFALAGREAETVTLATAAFRPRAPAGGEPRRRSRRDVVTGLEPYSYGLLLPRVVEILESVQGRAALATVTGWLNDYLVASDQYVGPDGYDLSHIWRPSISPHEQNHGFEDFGDALVDALRDLAVKQAFEGRPVAEVLATLERSQQPLLTRIAMHVLGERTARDEVAREQAAERLLDFGMLEACYRREYCEMASKALPVIERTAAYAWQDVILSPPAPIADRIRERAERLQDEGEPFEEAFGRAQDFWQLQLLSGIARDSLPETCADRRLELEEKHGTMEHADFPSWSSSWVGPSSPVSAEDVARLSPDEWIDKLLSWEPESSEPWQPSKEGLSRSFQEAVKTSPQPFLQRVGRFLDLGPTYMGALLGGLREAIQDGQEVSWSAIFEISQVVTAKVDDGDEVAADDDDETVWRYAQRSVASLLEIGASRDGENALAAGDYARAVDVLAPLIDHPDPTIEHEARYGGSNMDPLTLSLNTTRPAAMRAAIRIGSKARDGVENRGDGSQLDRVIDQVFELVSSRLAPERDPSLAQAAAFGEGLGRLVWMDPAWVTDHEHELLSSDSFGDVVLTVALASYRPGRSLMEALTPASLRLLQRVAAGEEIALGWRNDRSAVELLGDHLVMLLMWNSIERDDELVVKYFEDAPSGSVARVLGHLGWLLERSDGENVSEDVLSRARDLWDWRASLVAVGDASVEELSEFFWWVRIDQLASEWWVPRLAQAVEAPSFDSRGLIGERLASAASASPLDVVRILERLLVGRDAPMARYDLVEHAPGILAAAMDCGDSDAVETARRVMDLLGRGGQLRMKALVDQRRVGRS